MKTICLLGATGSIGTNCLDVVSSHADRFKVEYLTTYENVELLFEQAKQFHPKAVAVFKKDKVLKHLPRFKEIVVEVYTGFDGILEMSQKDDFDILVNAMVGAVGLQPTLNAIKPNRRIALANKETLVIGGELVMKKAERLGAEIIPIDSEHSAILQCLKGEEDQKIEKIILTASGGPFRELSYSKFSEVTVDQALNHPNWDMGDKITIDSATMMNKGLEVIEACWLFGVQPADIEVLIHPQSIIHSMVEFEDGSVKAQLGMPDMRIPIQYALSYPERLPMNFSKIDFRKLRSLTFEPPDFQKFSSLRLSYEAVEAGGAAPAVLNAANEEAVSLFLSHQIRFDRIPQIVEEALIHCQFNGNPAVDDLIHYDRMSREFVLNEYH